jgi:hypothetical protein
VARRVCDLENLVNEEVIARVGLQRHVKNSGVNRSTLPQAVVIVWIHNSIKNTLINYTHLSEE